MLAEDISKTPQSSMRSNMRCVSKSASQATSFFDIVIIEDKKLANLPAPGGHRVDVAAGFHFNDGVSGRIPV
jgi:hypothetical protein